MVCTLLKDNAQARSTPEGDLIPQWGEEKASPSGANGHYLMDKRKGEGPNY